MASLELEELKWYQFQFRFSPFFSSSSTFPILVLAVLVPVFYHMVNLKNLSMFPSKRMLEEKIPQFILKIVV